VLVTGDHVDAELSRVGLEGAPTRDFFGCNTANGFGFAGVPSNVTGSYSLHNSKAASLVSWAPIANISNAIVRVSDNDVADVPAALDVYGVVNSTIIYRQNRVQGAGIAEVGEARSTPHC